jgi:hypothetical protein
MNIPLSFWMHPSGGPNWTSADGRHYRTMPDGSFRRVSLKQS